jgi:DNA polymerase-1
MAFVCADMSQIEFRLIVHYIQNRACIDAYAKDPWTDFHQLVADLIGIGRGPGKTMNFAMGYGQGKKSTTFALSINRDFVGAVVEEVKKSGMPEGQKAAAIRDACALRAAGVYEQYHRMLPELKPTSRQAAAVAYKRGYVRNLYGRRRYLPRDRSHIAFNTVNQSSAGDMVKRAMVELQEQVPELLQVAQVHDEVLGEVPLELVERGDELPRRVAEVLADPGIELSVPVRATVGWSAENWAEAKSDERAMKF